VEKIPFSVYDFFAYLSSGAILLLTADYLWHLGLLRNQDVNVLLSIVLIILAYIVGQTVAQFSSFLLEQLVVGRLLKRPSIVLLSGKKPSAPLRLLFPNYYRPFSESTRQRILAQATSRNCSAEGEGLFEHVYPVVTTIERHQSRLDEFRNQYGFARNVSFALVVSAVAICAARFYGTHAVTIRWAVLAALGAVTMFYRYLKFFRQYSYELFLRYSHLDASGQVGK
jgi:hypothetical protein